MTSSEIDLSTHQLTELALKALAGNNNLTLDDIIETWHGVGTFH